MLKDYYAEKPIRAFLFLIHETGLSQRDAQRFIARGRLFVNGESMTDSSAVLEGCFQCVMFEPVTRGLEPIFKTAAFALFDKPSGVLVHPQNKNTPYCMVDEVRHHLGKNANITHRIDQETSGLLLAATNKMSERDLKMLFENRKIEKRYLAFVQGNMHENVTIEAPLIRKESDSAIVRLMVKVHVEGKPSKTDITVLKYYPDLNVTLVEARPLTGRQHQIRVHLFHVKHPIVGDPIYGQSEENAIRFLDKQISDDERQELSGANRLLLHANELRFNYIGLKYVLKSKTGFVSEGLKIIKKAQMEK